MDQKELRALEYRCIQEEPPLCTASCPIHVDARGFIGNIAAGQWEEASRILTGNMPLAGIVARICDHPCETACKRNEAGGPIAISELERTCVTNVKQRTNPSRIPAKNLHVTVIGTGLSSLTAAWDLLRKGYRVTIVGATDRPWTELHMFHEDLLPREVVEEEIDGLIESGARLRIETGLTKKDLPERIRDEFDAVYIGLDSEWAAGIFLDAGEKTPVDPITLATSSKGIFAGGQGVKRMPFSPILDVADGRRGATSIDRFLQNVSMTAARENEGPRETRLYTNMEDVVPEPLVPKRDVQGAYTKEEAVRESRRCMQCECMECVKNCLYMERFKGYPKRYIREIYNNATMLIGSHGQTNRLINGCSLCGLCGVICPNDVSMAEVCIEGRRDLVKRGKMPPSAHDFALQDMAFNTGNNFSLARHEPDREYSRFLFFPGCQLAGSSPEHVERVYQYLREHLSGGVGLMLHCCGAPAYWAGRDDLFREVLEKLRTEWEALGRPRIILACPTCYKIMKEHLQNMEIISLWELCDEIGLPSVPHPPHDVTVAVHDPCTARDEEPMQRSIRNILRRAGYKVEELKLSGEKTECCGYGGLMSTANPPLAAETAKRRAAFSESDYATYCAMCRDSLAATGKRVLHILDLFFVSATDMAVPRRRGLSERRENKHRLKERLLRSLWGESQTTPGEFEEMQLDISPEVLERMEKRRILREDVQKVIHYVETGGDFFIDSGSGRFLASFKPGHVTYWVEYTREGNVWKVHNAYSHRMEIADVSVSGSRGSK